MGRQVRIYDATLRDGTQAEGVSFSLLDKLEITQELDKLGLDYIEGGNPGSNPKDIEFFKKNKRDFLKKSQGKCFWQYQKKG